MISKSNEFTRRNLNFPAIRPCESVSFSGLLSSLLDLTCSICSFKSKTFFTNKKNAANSIHLVQTLLVFLEEIQIGISRHQTPAILCLSELHFIFQKLHFLLEDCTREDSRLWMLAKSEEASTHFRVLMRAVAVALDVLGSERFELDFEVEELVEFVRKQAMKSKFDVGRDDRKAMGRVLKIVNQFENGIAPESIDLIRVLEHLGIGSWNDCNEEIKFLESEIGRECGTIEKRDVSFLSSLMAFLIYCRCTLFSTVECVRKWSPNFELHDPMLTILNPDDLRCPISLEIMSDPVTLTTGHTYDRSSISQWLRSGNRTCPKTGEKLLSVNLVQNLALKGLIRKYCLENGVPFVESRGQNREFRSAAGGGSPAAEQAMALLATFLSVELFAGTEEGKNKSAYEIRLLTKRSVFNRACLAEAGVILPLLDVISSGNEGLIQENAMAALLNISKYSKSKKIIVENGGLELIVNVLNVGVKLEARQHAAGALFYLASVEENRRAMGGIPGCITGLMGLISDGPDRAKKNALVAVLGLLMYHENHWLVLSSGLVHLLVNLLISSENEEIITDSLAILARLGEKVDGSMAVIGAGVLPIVIEILSSSNSRSAKEYGISLLLSLCINEGVGVVPILVKNTSLMVSLYCLIREGTPRSSRKAGSLIKILHAFNEKSMIVPSAGREQFINVR